MVIPILSACCLPIKTGTGRYIDLTPDNGLDPHLSGCPVKINYSVHGAMIGNCYTVHPQFLCPGCQFLDFTGAVQQAVLGMDMQMCKCHSFSSFPVFQRRFPFSCPARSAGPFLVFFVTALFLLLYLEINYFSTVSKTDKGQVSLLSRNPALFSHLSLYKQFRVGITDCLNTVQSLQSPFPHHFRLR